MFGLNLKASLPSLSPMEPPRPEPITSLYQGSLEHRYMLILAPPGGGKSTGLKQLAFEHAEKWADPRPPQARLPVLIPLGDYVPEANRDWQQSFLDFIRSRLPKGRLKPELFPEDDEFDEQETRENILKDLEGGASMARRLEKHFEDGNLILLFDGLNEIRGDRDSVARELIPFIEGRHGHGAGNRFVFASRPHELPSTFKFKNLLHVEIKPLEDEDVRTFITHRFPQHQERLLGLVDGDRQMLDLLHNPFTLRAFCEVHTDLRQEAPHSRGALFNQLIGKFIKREEGRRPMGEWSALTTDIGITKPLISPLLAHALGALAYQMIDHGIRARIEIETVTPWLPSSVSFRFDRRDYHFQVEWDQVFKLAEGARILDLTRNANGDPLDLEFLHQQYQEFLAGRELGRQLRQIEDTELEKVPQYPGLCRLEPEKGAACDHLLCHWWRIPWAEAELSQTWKGEPSFRRARNNRWEGLPPLPATGFEQATILLSGLPREESAADPIVEPVLRVNPILAGQCLAEGRARVSDGLRERVLESLFRVRQDPNVAERVRIEAGNVLGELGDPLIEGASDTIRPKLRSTEYPVPDVLKAAMKQTTVTVSHLAFGKRFPAAEGSSHQHAEFILPALAVVPGCEAFHLGTDENDRGELRKQFPALGRAMPEYLLEETQWADGYRNHRQWMMESKRGWYLGEERFGPVSSPTFALGRFPVTNAEFRCFVDDGGYWNDDWWPTETLGYDWVAGQREEVESQVAGRRQPHRGPLPRFWSDGRFNRQNSPVVGVCWHEAHAYTLWLTAQIRLLPENVWLAALGSNTPLLQNSNASISVRLPFEHEWELAGKGPNGRLWAWGDHFGPEASSVRMNLALGDRYVFNTSPLGLYPLGGTPEGVQDMGGNVWEWTGSVYPHDAENQPIHEWNREALEGRGFPAEPARVLRGGAWDDYPYSARPSCRNGCLPDYRVGVAGFRLLFFCSFRR